MTEQVCIPVNSSATVFHDVGDDGRPTCEVGKRGPGEFRTVTRDRLRDDVRYCRFCSGAQRVGGTKGQKPSTRLSEMDPEDLGLTPMEADQ